MNKTCYFYWDSSPMAFVQTFGVLSFLKMNPDWKVAICVTRQKNEFKPNTYTRTYEGEDYFSNFYGLDRVEIAEIDIRDFDLPPDASTVLATDLFRTRILYEYGGIYSDHDVIWLKAMDHFKNIEHIGDINNFESICCFYNYTSGHHNVSILAGQKGSRYLKNIIDNQNKVRGHYTDQCWSAELLNKLFPNYEILHRQFPDVLAVKYETFYPYSTFDLSPLYKETDLSVLNDNVMAIHWFAGNALSNEYMKCSDFTGKCSMNEILKREGYI